MTCEEFRDCNETEESFLTLSRGERAACVAHYLACEDCREWIDDLPPEFVTPQAAADAYQETLALRDADLADPEFRTAAGLPPP